jgi:lipase chaperone LimK
MSLAEAWRDFLDEPVSRKEKRSRKKIMAQCLYDLATVEKSVSAARLLRDTVVGVEVEDRLSELEAKVQTLVGVTKHGTY